MNARDPQRDIQSGAAQGNKDLSHESPTPKVIDHVVKVSVLNLEYIRTTLAHLRYDTEDPFAIHVVFPHEKPANATPTEWVFARALFEEGLRVPTGGGAVCVCPDGLDWTLVELCGRQSVAVVQFESADLRRFLQHTYESVPAGREHHWLNLDRGLASLLKAA
ncbi:SsgA family sporulation/cell division regulator [Streptomyces mirabilis]|uniref:SsgA family sporulation/cell division regulator n=1 Tax=Streptomyces mirabilis TaxID=68239 RepID=UPI0036B8F0D3